MPAYFSISFELNKTKTAIKDFYKTLIAAGFVFKSGFWGCENESFDEIVAWNQNKLDDDFELGYKQHHSHDFKHILFDFSDFSEVRLYVDNQKKSATFILHLIIPEDDFLEWVTSDAKTIERRKYEKMDLLKEFSKTVWNSVEILAIQTAWECSNSPPRVKRISNYIHPQAEPFCILKESSVTENLGLPFEKIGRNGVLVEDRDNWNYL